MVSFYNDEYVRDHMVPVIREKMKSLKQKMEDKFNMNTV